MSRDALASVCRDAERFIRGDLQRFERALGRRGEFAGFEVCVAIRDPRVETVSAQASAYSGAMVAALWRAFREVVRGPDGDVFSAMPPTWSSGQQLEHIADEVMAAADSARANRAEIVLVVAQPASSEEPAVLGTPGNALTMCMLINGLYRFAEVRALLGLQQAAEQGEPRTPFDRFSIALREFQEAAEAANLVGAAAERADLADRPPAEKGDAAE